jgi:hypothetical protein
MENLLGIAKINLLGGKMFRYHKEAWKKQLKLEKCLEKVGLLLT